MASMSNTPSAPPRAFRMPLWLNVLTVLFLAFVLAMGVLAALWYAFDKPHLARPSTVGPSDLSSALKISVGTTASIGAVVALVVALRRQLLGEAEHHRQEKASDREQSRLFAERFARASDQLGSEKAAVRLAGIYAMAGLADDWVDGRQVCIDVLSAYLRMPFRPRENPIDYERPHGRVRAWEHIIADGELCWDSSEAQVRSTVIQVMRDHLWSGAATSWHGYSFDFTGAVFEEAAFDGMTFRDNDVRFDDCLFMGECGFSEVELIDSRLSFLGAVFGGRVGFEYSKVNRSELDLYAWFTAATDLNLQGLTLEDGVIRITGPSERGGSVSFVGARLMGGKIEIHATNTHKESSVAFSRSFFGGTDVWITGRSHTAGNIWCNGIDMTAGSLLVSPLEWAAEPLVLAGTEIAVDGARISGGLMAFRNVVIRGSEVHLNELEMAGGVIDFSSCAVESGSLDLAEAQLQGGRVIVSSDPAHPWPAALTDKMVAAGARLHRGPAEDQSC